MKKLFLSAASLVCGITVFTGVSFYDLSPLALNHDVGKVTVQAKGIEGNAVINGVKYKWSETSWSKNRGVTFNPGQHVYQLAPNPHDDPWYNKNQVKFYNQLVDQVKILGDAQKWLQDKWPNTISNVTVHGVNYTLAPR
ncbi:hypothetical protein [Listeria sp. PSOL-1]|uniref:hypothetical protein n=1 Tax=Listeria sp. PSOL-1 TaxID=1844999 RepID=UPI0013D283D8|nr:hypothetical protein [Listeria sp. PSOL-1]